MMKRLSPHWLLVPALVFAFGAISFPAEGKPKPKEDDHAESKDPQNHKSKGKGKGSGHRLPEALENSDFYDDGSPSMDKVVLGNFLFYDKVISGNRNISCASCHHALSDTGDGLSLPIGEGARGLGVTRDTGTGADAVHERVPRNAPPVWNLGAKVFTNMFHDGRIAAVPSGLGFLNPAGSTLPPGLENPLAVQAMFPVTSATEMAGQAPENEIAIAVAVGNLAGPNGVWELLAKRLQDIPEYLPLFQAAYPGVVSVKEDITFVQAANAIATFEAFAWRADNSPFDEYLRGDHEALNGHQKRGMELFYGKARCYDCHSGSFQTDLDFHSIAMPQIGPGKGDGFMGHDDFGREKVTGDPADRYRFRTPPLRNVALNAPYGHSGAFATLDAVIRHHLDPVASLNGYNTKEAILTPRPDLDGIDFLIHDDAPSRAALAASNELEPAELSDREISDLVAFLRALTDPNSIDLRNDVPVNVPSGLSIVE